MASVMELLKDRFFNRDFVQRLGASVHEVRRDFDESAFLTLVMDREWKNRELKDRMRWIAACLREMLPEDYRAAIDVLAKVAKKIVSQKKNGFEFMIFPDFVEQFGVGDLEASVPALELFTRTCSSEYAVRPFLKHYRKEMISQMSRWAWHPNHHVRRLASEGLRPRLPWGMAVDFLKTEPEVIIPILEKLKDDDSDYVRRSVANNLNDISRSHPGLVLSLAQKWSGRSLETDQLLKHALRTLLKKGDAQALALFGFSKKTSVRVSAFEAAPKNPRIGEGVRIRIALSSAKTESVRLEYHVGFLTAKGKVSKKVFQIAETRLLAGKPREWIRSLRFRDLTTRKHFPGKHRLDLSVNGRILGSIWITLKK